MNNIHKILGIAVLALMFMLQSFKTEPAEGINYTQKSWSKISKQAKKEKKLIFVYVGVKDCHTCHQLQKSFADPKVAKFYNENFVNYYLDGGSTVNIIKANGWGVKQVPSMVYFDEKKNVVLIKDSLRTPDELIRNATEAIDIAKTNKKVRKK